MKKTYFILGGVSAIALLVAGLTAASAFGPNTKDGNQEDRQGQRKQRPPIHEMLEVDNYDDWVAKITEIATEHGREVPEIVNLINADNFDKFQEMHELMKSGDREAAKAIAEKLGLPERPEKGERGEKREERQEHREEMQKFMQDATYDEWVVKITENATEMGHEPKMLEVINAQNFDTFKQIHELHEAGDHEAARELADSIGLEKPGPKDGKQMGKRGEQRFGGEEQ